MLVGDRHKLHKVYNKMVEEVISGRMVQADDLLSFEGIGPAMMKTHSNLTVAVKDFDSTLAIAEGLKLVAGESNKHGERIKEQMEKVIELLKENKCTRKAVIYLDTNITAVQFIIRNDTLETIVNVKSWDIYKDLPRDLLSFGILAQVVAKCLNVLSGYIYYTVTSSYMYPQTMNHATTEVDLEFNLGPSWPLPGNVWYAYSLRASHALKEYSSYDMMNPGLVKLEKII